MSSPAPYVPLPRWVDVGVLPAINLLMALVASGLVVLVVGENPIEAVRWLLIGAFGYEEALGYTLYYTTNFIFTGLAVAVAFHAGLFNIGGEGQAYIGGLGVGLAFLTFDAILPGWLLIPIGIVAAGLFGAAWAFIPAWLQAYRGSHIVITTIMFNFIASALMVYLLVNVLIMPGQMSPETRPFADAALLPQMHEVLGWIGIDTARSPLNLSLILALLASVGVWAFLWRTPWGYELRAAGHNPNAAIYAGIRTRRLIVTTMCISGMLAGLVAVNEVMGVQHRLVLNFTAGNGFAGIAVALMGRNHPVGIILASFLFGVLYQGGAELAFELPRISREMTTAIQGLIILFSGALAYMMRGVLERAWRWLALRFGDATGTSEGDGHG
jgi:simple sugar transport system permease protein